MIDGGQNLPNFALFKHIFNCDLILTKAAFSSVNQ